MSFFTEHAGGTNLLVGGTGFAGREFQTMGKSKSQLLPPTGASHELI